MDENIPLMTVEAMRQMGHDVSDIRRSADEGLDDDTLWQRIQTEERLLITTDTGFAAYRNESHHGVLIVHLRQPNRGKIHARVMQALAQFHETEWRGLLVSMRDTAQSVWRKTE